MGEKYYNLKQYEKIWKEGTKDNKKNRKKNFKLRKGGCASREG